MLSLLMEILSASGPDLEKAAAVLSAGGLVAFPTETVYGLGADAFSLSGLAQIFEAKNRPRFDPLIIHIAERGALSGIADTSSLSRTAREKLSILSEKLWPGPLTLVLPKRPEVPDLATAGLPTVAVRFPSHPVAQKLIFLSTGAVAAPSANPFGFLSPTRAEHVKTQLGEIIDIIVDGGKTSLGLESTVLDISGELPMLLRPGGTPKETIEALIGPVGLSSGPSPETGIGGAVPLSPGQMKSHYAPRTPLVLYRPGTLALLPDAADEGRLYFALPGREKKTARDRTRVLSETGDLAEAAANFFDMLHELDSLGLKLIWAEEAPGFGLGLAINDRLRRAESGRQ
jgi:L-threonylcarbamoyladenylate synthase